MRCPKCGYISFDHVKTCLKCKKDISGKVEVIGTTYHAAAPSFLKASLTSKSEDTDGFIESESEQIEGGADFSDPDLDVLVNESDDFSFDDDDDAENTISFDSSDSDDVEAEFHLEDDEDFDDEGSFEFELEADGEELDEQLTTADLDVPGELSDISDLAPPATGSDQAPAGGKDMSLSLDDDMSFGDDLELDGLDLDLGLGGDEGVDDSEQSLSLDDIDLSEDDLLSGDDDFDNLNMDLDLDGLDDEESKPKEEKALGSLDDISLSLD